MWRRAATADQTNALWARVLSHPHWPVMVAGIAIVLTLPSLWTGLVVDDYVHRAMLLRLPGFASNPLDLFSFVRDGAPRAGDLGRLALPWWSADDLKLSFWRPVAALTHLLDYTLWPDAPWLMHLHSVLWYIATVIVVGLLFRRVFDVAWQAGLAMFVYAVSHTHAVPVFFLANRNALLGVCFGAAALLLHQRWRRQGSREAAVLAPAVLLLGLLACEGTIAAGGYLLAYAAFLDRGTPKARALSLAPYFAVVAAWRFAYNLLGHGAAASEAYIDPVTSPARFLSAIATRGPIDLLAQWLLPPADWSRLVSAPVFMKWWLFAIGFLAVLMLMLLPVLKRDATARFWCAGMWLSLVPSCATFPMDRMLLHSGIGGAALLAQFASAVWSGQLVPRDAHVRKLAARVFFDVLIALHVLVSPIWLPLRIVTTAGSFRDMTDGIAALAARDDLSHKLVVLVDDVQFTGAYFPSLRALAGREPAEDFLVLAPVEGRFDRVSLSRPTANTLVMEVDGTYAWFLERDRTHPFAVGDRVQRRRMSAEIVAVTTDGRPTKIAFHFDTPLEDDSIAWFGRLESPSDSAIPMRGRYPAWTPPVMGQTADVR